MKTCTILFFLLTILCFALSTASAQYTLFTSGPINGNLNTFFIDGPGGPFGQSISDEFVATATGTAGGLNFGEWTLGGAPTIVSWALGTTSFGSDIASGGGTVTYTSLGTDEWGYGIYRTQVSISGFLNAGHTYYLTLSGANDVGGTQFDGWDDNESLLASCYFENPNGSAACPTTESESFTISGGTTTSSTTTCWGCCGGHDGINCIPEPSTILLFGSGIVGLAGMLLRKLNF